jgi:solute carrier family 41
VAVVVEFSQRSNCFKLLVSDSTPWQRWRAMREVDQLIMVIPVVLNLKGNLKMNLSPRLGTAANIGELDDPSVRRFMIIGNLSLLQVQAISVSFIASCTALTLGNFVPQNTPMPVNPGSSPAISKNSTARAATVRDIHDYTTIDSRHAFTLPSPGTIRKSGFPRSYSLFDFSRV